MIEEIEGHLARKLSDDVKAFIEKAESYLLHPTLDKFNHLKSIETSSLKFSAISSTKLQITIGRASVIEQIRLENQNGIISPTVIADLTSLQLQAPVAPLVMKHFHGLPIKLPMIFFGGGVRSPLSADMLMRITYNFMSALIEDNIRFAVLTDGYKGNDTNEYPSTRAPHDISQFFRDIPRYVIMPQCANGVCHQSVHAWDNYGENWGDEAPALTYAADAAIFFAPFNLITEYEIILALKQKKPAFIIDPTQKEEIVTHKVAKCGYVYPEGGIKSYKSPEAAAMALSTLLKVTLNPSPCMRSYYLEKPDPSPNRRGNYNLIARQWSATRGVFDENLQRIIQEDNLSAASVPPPAKIRRVTIGFQGR